MTVIEWHHTQHWPVRRRAWQQLHREEAARCYYSTYKYTKESLWINTLHRHTRHSSSLRTGKISCSRAAREMSLTLDIIYRIVSQFECIEGKQHATHISEINTLPKHISRNGGWMGIEGLQQSWTRENWTFRRCDA